mgnify:CR=1 FL=1
MDFDPIERGFNLNHLRGDALRAGFHRSDIVLQRGQNGFQLSLLGFDSDFDHNAIVKEARGRRIVRAAPDRELGGVEIEPSSDILAALDNQEGIHLSVAPLRYGFPPRCAPQRVKPVAPLAHCLSERYDDSGSFSGPAVAGK